MGLEVRRKNKWTKEEEDALLAGISRHGAGNWKEILRDPDFSTQLVDRNNVNLKDKWRNLKKSMTNTDESPSVPTVVSKEPCPTSSSDKRRTLKKSMTNTVKSPSVSTVVSKKEPCPTSPSDESRYDAIIFEALSTISDEEDSDHSKIRSDIEVNKIVSEQAEEVREREVEVAAEEAARRIAESENKRFIAAEAVREMEYAEKILQENELMRMVCSDLLQQSNLKKLTTSLIS